MRISVHLLFGHSAAHFNVLPVDEPDCAADGHGVVVGLLTDLAVPRGQGGHSGVDVDQLRRRDARFQVPL